MFHCELLRKWNDRLPADTENSKEPISLHKAFMRSLHSSISMDYRRLFFISIHVIACLYVCCFYRSILINDFIHNPFQSIRTTQYTALHHLPCSRNRGEIIHILPSKNKKDPHVLVGTCRSQVPYNIAVFPDFTQSK